MNRNILMGLTLSAVVALVVLCCNDQPEVPLPQPTALPGQVAPPMTPPGTPTPGMQTPGVQTPVAPPVAAPTPVAEAPLPRTELIPISEEEDDPEPKKVAKVGTGICKLPGPETPGDELLGNYTCAFNVKGLPFGLSPPPVSCSIRKTSDGSLRVKRSGGEAGNFGGAIAEHKAGGFRVDGNYNFSGNKLKVGACMKRKGAGKFQGSGSGVLNGDKKNKLKYTLTMTKK